MAIAACGALVTGLTAVAAPVAARGTGHPPLPRHHAQIASAIAVRPLTAQALLDHARASERFGGGLTGIVQGAAGGLVRGICVTATGAAGTASATTGTDGRYQLTGLPAGSYKVSYRDCGVAPRYFEQWSGGADLAGSAVPVIVRFGQQTSLRPVTLRPTSPAVLISATAQRRRQHPLLHAAASNPVTISGTVRSRSGRRLRGICVFAYPPGNYFAGAGVTTSRRGNYTFAGFFAPGRYLVQFTNCSSHGNFAPQWWKRSATQSKATVLKLKSGQKATHIDGLLGPGGTLSGKARAAGTGTPLGGICVDVMSTDRQAIYQFQVTTKADGTYSLTNMASARYRLQFQPDCGNTGNYLSLSRRGTVRITAGRRTGNVNASLPPGAEISGVVTGPGATPLDGICVYENGNTPSATTGPDGSYSIQRLFAGSGYEVGFAGGCGNKGSYAPQFFPGQVNPAEARPFSLSAGEMKTGVDGSLGPGGTVTGTVRNAAGAKLSGICVALLAPASLVPNDQNLFVAYNLLATPDFAANAQTRNGGYEMRNIAPGLYYATFSPCNGTGYAPQWFPKQSVFAHASLISVGAGGVTPGINAVLARSGSISGVVTSTAGRRISGECVSADNLSGQDPYNYAPQAVSRRGAYRIRGVAPGRYAVFFGPCVSFGQLAPQWYPAASSEASARVVIVRAGQTSGRISTVLISGGSISGRVRLAATGKGARFCFVTVTDTAGNWMGSSLTNEAGHFDLRHLRAGRYDLAACIPFGSGVIKAGVVVRNSRVTGVTINVPTTGSLRGRVLDGSGTVAEPGVCITAFPQSGHGFVQVAPTGADGRYELSGLNPGRYRVLFSPVCLAGFAAVAPQWFNDRASQASATAVTVVAGQTRGGVDARLLSYGGISGTVTDSAHSPVAGICVTAASVGVSATPVVAVTAVNGAYSLGDLAPGSYTLEFSSGCGATGFATQFYNGVRSIRSASPVAVTAGITRPGIDATMKR